jgi:hypothetical protein
LVLGQGTNGEATFTVKGTGQSVAVNHATLGGLFAAQRASVTGAYFGCSSSTEAVISSIGAGGVLNVYRNGFSAVSAQFSPTGNLLIGTTTDMTGSGGLKIAGTTAATTTTSGALIVAGGVGVSGAGYFGGNGAFGPSFTPQAWGTGGALDVNGTTGGIVGVAYNGAAKGYVLAESGGILVNSHAGGTAKFNTGGSGATTLGNTGSVTTINATTANIPSTTSASSSTVGALTIGNGTAATNVAIGGGKVNIGSTEASVGSTSGALQVAGGVYAGAASVFGGDVTLGTTTATVLTHSVVNSKAAGQGDAYYLASKSANGYSNGLQLYKGGTPQWTIGSGITAVDDNFKIYDANAGVVVQIAKAATLASTTVAFNNTGATTFAGAVTIAGTVIHTLSATPASASATGTVGTMSWDANYIYICTAANTWKRVAIATW